MGNQGQSTPHTQRGFLCLPPLSAALGQLPFLYHRGRGASDAYVSRSHRAFHSRRHRRVLHTERVLGVNTAMVVQVLDRLQQLLALPSL